MTTEMLDAALNVRELERLRTENAEMRARELRAATEKIDWQKWASRLVIMSLLAIVGTLAGLLWKSQTDRVIPAPAPAPAHTTAK